MIAHKIVTALRAYPRRFASRPPNDLGWSIDVSFETALHLADMVEQAQKFDVSIESLERFEQDEFDATVAAMGQMGLLRLPFPLCYAEFPTNRPGFSNFSVIWESESHPGSIFAHMSMYVHGEDFANVHTNYFRFEWLGESLGVEDLYFYDRDGTVVDRKANVPMRPEQTKNRLQTRVLLSRFLALLATRNVTLRKVDPPEKLNRARAKKGHVPLFEHTMVEIKPEEVVYEGGRSSSGQHGTHASPRIHLRRGHVRQLTDRKTFVRPCIVGTRKEVVTHDYRI